MSEGLTCVYVSNLPININRTLLKSYYSQFGNPIKCYLPNTDPSDPTSSKITKKWAKIYFDTVEEAKSAINGTNNDPVIDWKACVFNKNLLDSYNSSPNEKRQNIESDSDDMDQYDDGYFLVEPIEGYVDVHGRPLTVMRDEMNEIYVPLREIRRTGFEIFRKDNFNVSFADYKQKAKEFEMHLLSMGRQYLLANKVNFSENDIVDTLKRVEQRLRNSAVGGDAYESEFKKTHNFIETEGGNLTIVAKSPVAGNNVVSPGNNRSTNNHLFANQTSRRAANNTPRNNFNNNIPSTSGINKQQMQGRRNLNDNANRKFPEKKINIYANKPAETKSNDEGSSGGSVKNTSIWSGNSRPQNGFSNAPPSLRKPKAIEEKTEESISKLEQVKMGAGAEDVTVIVTDKQKENIYWVQLERFSNYLCDVVKAISDANPEKLQAVKPVVNQYYLAEFEGEWHRAKVLKITNNIQVHFVDYGNVCSVDIVKKLPDKLRSQPPALAVRIAIQRDGAEASPPPKLEEYTTITVIQRKIFDDGTYGVYIERKNPQKTEESPKIDNVVKTDNSSASKVDNIKLEPKKEAKSEKPMEPTPVKPVEQVFITGFPPPMAELKHGEKIGIKGIEGARLLMVNKQSVIQRRKLFEYISSLDKTKLNLSSVKENQMVLCGLEGATGLYRAIVTKVNKNTAIVKYVDEAGSTELSIKSLRNVDEYLSKQPACLLTSPEIPLLKNIKKSMARIEEVIANNTKMIVVKKGDEFDLEFQDKTMFCDEIRKLEAPPVEAAKKEEKNFDDFSDDESPKIEEVNEAKQSNLSSTETTLVAIKPKQSADGRIMYSDMIFPEIVAGVDNFICQALKDFNNFIIVATDEQTEGYLRTVLETTVTDTTPYQPIEFEMCLALYEEDENWYRAVVTDILPDNKYTVLFVDFGNEEIVSDAGLRKLPPHLKDIPVLGIIAELVDIPQTPKVFERLKEIFVDNETKEINVKEVVDSKIQVTVPEWYDILKKEGLI